MSSLQPATPASRLSTTQAEFRASFLAKLRAGIYTLEVVSHCPCGAPGGQPVASSDRFGIPVGVVLCTECGLLRTTPRLAPSCLPKFYQSEYHGLHMGIQHPDPSTSLYRRGQGAAIYAFMRHALPAGPLRVAEVGSGTGSVLREFADAAAADGVETQLVGCEYADGFASVGRSMGTDIRTGGVETLADIDPPHVLILSHVVEHFPALTDELRDIRAMTAEQTVVYVEVPGVLTIHRKPEYDYAFRQYFTLAHNFHFTLATLRDAMARSGFRLVAGDEHVRSIFRRGVERGLVDGRSDNARGVREYLAWLDRSPTMRLRRAAVRAGRRGRRAARAGVRGLRAERSFRAVRAALGRGATKRE